MDAPAIEKSCATCFYRSFSPSTHPCRACSHHSDWKAQDAPTAAIKHDSGKARHSLIPFEVLDGLARLYTKGAEKYEARNWEKGMEWSRLYDALQRHVLAWFDGQDHCPEDGQHHLLSVLWCAAALYTYQARAVGTDDRPPRCPGSCHPKL